MINTNYKSQYTCNDLKFGSLIKVNMEGIPKETIAEHATRFIKSMESAENKEIAAKIKDVAKDFLAKSARIYTVTGENINITAIKEQLPKDFINIGDIFIATGKHATEIKVAEKAEIEAKKTKNQKIINSKLKEAKNIYNNLIKGKDDFIIDNEILDIKMDVKADYSVNYSVEFSPADKLKLLRKELDNAFKDFRKNPDSVKGSVIKVLIPGSTIEQQDTNLNKMLTKMMLFPKISVNNAFKSIDEKFDPNNICFFSLCDTNKGKLSTVSYVTTGDFADLTDKASQIRKKFPKDSTDIDEIIHEYMEEMTKKQSNKIIALKQVHGNWSAKIKKE